MYITLSGGLVPKPTLEVNKRWKKDWDGGYVTFPAFMWEQLFNAINPDQQTHDYTEEAEAVAAERKL